MARLEFAKQYEGLDWKVVCFTDSKMFTYQYTSTGSRRKFKWCMHNEIPVAEVAKKLQKIHIYSGITYYGMVPIVIVTGTTQAKYIQHRYNTKGVQKWEYLDVLEHDMIP